MDTKEAESAMQLEARGRVQDQDAEGRVVYNCTQRIDGARLVTYDVEARLLTIRLDHSECPGFWAEVQLPLEQLDRFVALHP